MIVQVSSGSSSVGAQCSHSPAKEKGRLLHRPLSLPFIEPSCYDETATFLKADRNAGLCNCLSLRIDILIIDLGTFCPRWNQAPSKLNESAYCGIGVNSDGHNGLSWSDIVAGLKEWRFLDLDCLAIMAGEPGWDKCPHMIGRTIVGGPQIQVRGR